MDEDQIGDIADGPNGPIVFTERGWVPMGQSAAPQGRVVRVPNPAKDAKEAQAQALELARFNLAQQAAARAAEAANKPPAGYVWGAPGPDGTPTMLAIPGGPADKQNKPAQALRQGDSDKLRTAANQFTSFTQVNDGFKDDFGGNLFGGMENTAQGFFDVGTPNQRNWWSSLYEIDNLIRNDLFGASLTQGEKQAYERTTISPGMTPKQIKLNLDRRERVMGGALRRYVTGLKAGGWNPNEIDAMVGEVAPRLEPGYVNKREEDEKPPALNLGANADIPPIGGNAPPSGPETDPSRVYNQDSGQPMSVASGTLLGPEKRKEYDYAEARHFDAMIRQGASLEQLNAEAAQRGRAPFNASEVDAVRAHLRKYPSYDGLLVNPQLKLKEQTGLERAAQGIPGAAFIGSANATGLGALDLAAPEQMAMVRAAHPYAEAGGEIAALIKGGRVGGQLLNKAASGFGPGVGQAVREASPFARSLGGDTAYGAARGAITNPDDPIGGALYNGGLAMAGSAAGNTLGAGTGAVFSGAKSSPALTRLREQGVVPTIGQIARAGAGNGRSMLASAEDMISNTPIAGSLVNTRRMEGLEQANNAGYRIAAQGDNIEGAGLPALQQLEAAKNAAYSPLENMRFALDDPRFVQQFQAARDKGLSVDAARGKSDFDLSMQQGIRPLVPDSGIMTGRNLQDALRFTQGQSRAYTKAANGAMPDPSANYVAGAFDDVNNAFTGLAARSNREAIPILRRANRMNRGLSVLDDAASRAEGTGNVWSGSQLINAIKANNSKFGSNRGALAVEKSPLGQLGRDMNEVLPNQVPPTGVNVAPMLAAIGATSGAAGTYTDNSALQTLGAALLLSSPYTKTGSKVLAKTLLDRPDSVKAFGEFVRKKKGLFGSALVPLALEYGR